MYQFQFFPLFEGKETDLSLDYALGVPDGIRGPVMRVVWAHLIKGRSRGNLIAQVAPGEPGEGKIVINEAYSTFAGKVGDMTLIGITAEVQKHIRDSADEVQGVATRFYGKHAEIFRYWHDCPAAEPIISAPSFKAGSVKSIAAATEALGRAIAIRIQKSTFRVENSLVLQAVRSGWQKRFQRTIAETLKEAA
jgi:hypothetical protein